VYDDLVRISSVNCGPTSPNGSTWTQSFTYDPFGNINKSGSLSFLPTYTGSASTPTTNQFYQIPGGPAGASNYYDLNGNLTTDVTNTYSWDADGNSVKINSIGLAYDALDRRVEQNNAGTYTQILYSPIGSARLESNMAEHEYGDLAYAPFGESYAILNTPYPSFTGQQQDTVPGSGLYDFLYREYSAVQGRWNSPDPAGFGAADPSNPQSWNRYAYALNNPLRYKDPSGLILCDYGPSDNGGEDFEDADDPNECTSNGGTLPTDRTTVTVNGDSPGDVDTIENGQQIYPQIVQSYAANNGLTVSAAPPTPWYKNPCVTKAIAKGALSTGIDAIGLIPGGGAVSAELSLFNGAAAVSNGTAILGRLQLGAGIITAANGASDTSGLGAIQTVAGVGGIVAGVAKATPVVGQVLSGISVGLDLIGTGMNIAQCY
jgi:RHS repeat-associated protein